jgi:hypothetical protein
MRRVAFASVLASVFVLSGCWEKSPTEETHTVDWFIDAANEQAHEETLKRCNKNPGELDSTPNCINAKQAFRVMTSRAVTGKDPHTGIDKYDVNTLHTVEYFMEESNNLVLDVILSQCEAYPKENGTKPNCANAKEASRRLDLKSSGQPG